MLLNTPRWCLNRQGSSVRSITVASLPPSCFWTLYRVNDCTLWPAELYAGMLVVIEMRPLCQIVTRGDFQLKMWTLTLLRRSMLRRNRNRNSIFILLLHGGCLPVLHLDMWLRGVLAPLSWSTQVRASRWDSTHLRASDTFSSTTKHVSLRNIVSPLNVRNIGFFRILCWFPSHWWKS